MSANLDEKQKALLERAGKGLLKHLIEQGGTVALGDLHAFSERRFFIAHQAFSRLMEDLTARGLVDFNWDTRAATITDAGRAAAA